MEIFEYSAHGIEERTVVSTLDGSEEPVLFRRAKSDEKRPLLVVLHTWSYDRHNEKDLFVGPFNDYDMHCLWPEFRGPNTAANPRGRQACASKLAMQDIVDAVEAIKRDFAVDENMILLFGASGGGHMAQMMAGYAPKLWRSVAAFVGISDVARWYNEMDSAEYRKNIEHCMGGAPEDETLLTYRERSPITYAENITQCELTLYHGKWDKSVPFEHSVRLFNLINERAPKSRVFLEIFDGGHEMPEPMIRRHIESVLFADSTERRNVTG